MTAFDTPYFELKESGDFIKIDLLNLLHPNAELDWDRNWIEASVFVKAGGFSGHFNCALMTTDFGRFRNQFADLYDKLDGTAKFDTIEGQINIIIKGDGIGHFVANCFVMDIAGIGNKLEFEINFDQTFIPKMINQLENITKTFPVFGDLN